MPFTLTHIAAGIPIAWLCRWKIPFSALAVGTMIPDGGIFFPRLMNYVTFHSNTGILTHCLPVGLVAYYLYSAVLKRPLIDLFPTTLRGKLLSAAHKPNFNLTHIAAACLLITLGASTHIVWDSFTHNGRWGTTIFPALKTVAFTWKERAIPWYHILQHGSSVVLLPPMMIAFFAWVWKQPVSDSADTLPKLSRKITWPAIGLMMTGTFSYWLWLELTDFNSRLEITTAFAVKHSGTVHIVLTLIYCVAMQIYWLMHKRDDRNEHLDTD